MAEGIHNYPGNKGFLVGAAVELETEKQKNVKEGKQMVSNMIWQLNKIEKDLDPALPVFDASKYPMIAYNIAGQIITFVSDPDVVQDMYGKHNKNIDKHNLIDEFFSPIFKNTFVTMPTNDEWKTKRKACAHMFFKSKLKIMTGVFQQHLNKSCDKWLSEIKANGETRIDISVEYERVFAHATNHICFGEDFNDDKFDFDYYNVTTREFAMKKVSMREAVQNIAKQTFTDFFGQFNHPIRGPARLLFGVGLDMGVGKQKLTANSARLSAQVNKYVQDRKNGVTKSKMDGCDLLSVFLESPDIFSDRDTVQNLIAFIFAATETTHFTSQTVTSMLAQRKDFVAKMRKEFTEKIYNPCIEEDPSLSSLSDKEVLDKIVEVDTAQDLEFTTMCTQEAMRVQPAAQYGHNYIPRHDLKLGKYNFKKGDMLIVNFVALGYNSKEW